MTYKNRLASSREGPIAKCVDDQEPRCYRQSNNDPRAEVELTHLGEDGSFLEAADVDPGASSGDTSDGPTGRRDQSDREASRMLAQYGTAVP